MEVPGLHTLEDVAQRFGVSARTVERWRRQGKLPEPHRVLGRLVWHTDELLDLDY